MTEDTGSTPVAEAIVDTPNPILDTPIEQAPEPIKDTPKPEEAKPVEKPSIRDSLKAAEEKLSGGDKAKAEPVNVDEKVDVKDKPAPVKDQATGKFIADAPSRFSPEAKAEWGNAPETVKAEVRRALAEQENGIKEYQAKFETLKPYEEIAKKAGTTIPAALENYLNLEKTLAENPIAGLQRIFDYVGISPRDYAAQILGQVPDAQASQQDTVIRDLKAQIEALKQEVTGVTTTIQGQKQAEVLSQIDAFAAEHPRFDELSDTITEMLQLQTMRGEQTDLAKAYEMAERLNPAPNAPNPVSPQPDLSAQTARAAKSITGSPSHGSYPALNGPSSSIKDALRKAMLKAS